MNRFFRSRAAGLSDYSALILFLVVYLAVLAMVIAPDRVLSTFFEVGHAASD